MHPPSSTDPTRRSILRLLAGATAAAGLGALSGTTPAQDDDVPTAGEFPVGETVGLQQVAEGLPAPTDFLATEVDGEVRHYVVTQTGHVFVGTPAADGAATEPADVAGEENATQTDGNATQIDGNATQPDENATQIDGNATDSDIVLPGDENATQPGGQNATQADGQAEGAGPTEYVFEGRVEAWIGREPSEIDGEENPTLELTAGETYRFTWINGDGAPHNVVVLDGDDEVLERTEIVSEQGAEQTLEFEATEEMARYLCEVHPSTMVGEVQVSSAEDGPDEQQAQQMEEDGAAPEPPEGMELFLDVSDRLVELGIGELGGYDERGLLSMALHPDFAQNRTFYLYYSAPERHDLGYDHTDVLAEFQADQDATSADPESERTIVEVPQPQDNHNGGQLAFGPDGALYLSIGDGGNVHDVGIGHVEDWYEENLGGNGQDTTQNLLGGVHRIEVDPQSDEEAEGPRGGAYEVPQDNPLVGADEYLDEYFAWGFRNPWGMSIDEDGTVFVADAGQHTTESLYVVGQGGNYSWNVKEGSRCFSPETPLEPPADCPDTVDDSLPAPRGGEQLRDPIAEYRHTRISEAFIDSSVIVGGHRYAGDALSGLQDDFVFGNWSSQGVVEADGEVLVARPPENSDLQAAATGEEQWPIEELEIAGSEDGTLNRYLYGVERDQDGELYLLTNTDYRPFAPTGEIYRVVPEGEGEDVPEPEQTQTVDPGATEDGADGDEEFATPGDRDLDENQTDGNQTDVAPEEERPEIAEGNQTGVNETDTNQTDVNETDTNQTDVNQSEEN